MGLLFLHHETGKWVPPRLGCLEIRTTFSTEPMIMKERGIQLKMSPLQLTETQLVLAKTIHHHTPWSPASTWRVKDICSAKFVELASSELTWVSTQK